ncbi:putative 3-beta-hydroxysteroid-Delta(8),Delta(7)-isomerase [Apostasia shenzhenica]|uniref:Putative 3-beta-hydroxysteroid-Delta(8),Delta(7)-isomerase n=1 Tax=Apostasia shenzhenica TaxID=1088818 RepID=A0A2I0AA87_9ASPA|nr:putative 3-beta-hydroxysteroid-Delta(8),Delta(7)-isomerase [Apostasia shenzhenica]
MATVSHPYVPRDLQLPGYVPLAFSQFDIVVPYVSASVLVVAAIWILSGYFPKLSKVDRVLICWWVFTGFTHIIVEGYFAFVPDFFRRKSPFYLSEVWKEYSKGDSRYVGRNSAIVSVEGFTAAIEGPASLLAVYAIASRKPYSHILQFAISLGQLYGCVIYFATAILDGDNFSTSPYYYWAYYIGANSSWVVIPTLISIRSWKKIAAAFEAENKRKIS